MSFRNVLTGLGCVWLLCATAGAAAHAGVQAAGKFVARGLEWETGEARKMTWDEARTECRQKGMSLPEHNSLLSALLRNEEVSNPEGRYWAAGDDTFDSTKAWYAESYTRKEFRSEVKTAPKTERNFVRCVRKAE